MALTSLEGFWQFLNFRQGLDASSMEWCAVLGDSAWQHIRSRLFEGAGLAAVCQPSGEERLLDVVPASSGYQLVCDATGVVAATGIKEADVRCYRLDVMAVRRAIASALDIRANPTAITNLHNLCAIGNVAIDHGLGIPAYLSLPATPKLFIHDVQGLCMRSESGFLVLTSNDGTIDDVTAAMIKSKGGFVCLLTDVIGWDGSSLAKLNAWQSILDSYRAHHLAAVASARGLTVTKPSRSKSKNKRADRAPKIERLTKALIDHIRAARDHAYASVQRGEEPSLLPRPTKSMLAKTAGVKDYDVSRCFNDEPQLGQIWNIADCLDDVMQYGR